MPLYFVRYIHSSTTLMFPTTLMLPLHYIHGSAAFVFRTLYPWLYEVLAHKILKERAALKSLFSRVTDLRCFHVNSAKFLRTYIL